MSVEQEIASILDKALEEGTHAIISTEDVREWLTEYLEMRKEDIDQFPEEATKSHWDLLAADSWLTREAAFLAALFVGDQVTLIVGRGEADRVKAFGESEFPENPEDLIIELRRNFRIAEDSSSTLELDALSEWLQR